MENENRLILKPFGFLSRDARIKERKNMVYEKPEKHHNIQNVKNFKNMPKSEIHPNWFPQAPVLCEGKTLCSIGSTKPQLQLDVWLGNHPFIQTHKHLWIVKGV